MKTHKLEFEVREGKVSHSWVLKTFKSKSSCFIIIKASPC